ncbi:MAG: MATE family efflux transporter [Clostridium sp.]
MKKINLTEGNITKSLLALSLPIIMTNFIQTAYGMVDMIWIGRLGSDAVAAIGTASFFINLSFAIATIVLIGTGVKLSHAIGRGEHEDEHTYIDNGIIMIVILGIIYMLFLIVFRKPLIDFYKLGNPWVTNMAEKYLVISAIGIVVMYLNSLFTIIFNSYGNSKMPFRANTTGFIFNIILDPILIFGLFHIPQLGVLGAAFSTLISRCIVLAIFLWKGREQIGAFKEGIRFRFDKAKEVMKLGFPVTIQRVTFSLISITIGRIVSDFGATAIAVQKVGVQIESVSYVTIGGLQGAISAFVGQNYGADKKERIIEGYKKALTLTIIFGGMVSLIFILFPKMIFSIFLPDPSALEMGAGYMRILGFSQVFMCMELLTVGAFNGIGKTHVPPFISTTFSLLRIPCALILSSSSLLGLDGIWWSISISSVFKGVILVSGFVILIRKYKRELRMKN